MHPSSILNMQKALEMLLWLNSEIDVLDVGGRNIKADRDRSYKHLVDCKNYYIADLNEGYNVTHKMPDEYTLPFEDRSIDLVVSGQTLEHVRNPFRLVTEMVRVLKHSGYIILIAPSTGRRHDMVDYWRFMDDAFHAIAYECGLKTVADWIDKSAPDERSAQWSDHVFIGKKP